MARVTTVERCQKSPGRCGKCGVEIKKGEPYRHASPGFRGPKLVRCMKPECGFRDSDLTTSKMSAAYSACEDAEETIAQWDGEDKEDVAQALNDCAEACREVASEYEESIESAPMLEDQCRESIDQLEGFADDLESAASDLPDLDGDDDRHAFVEGEPEKAPNVCEECGEPQDSEDHLKDDQKEKRAEWVAEVKQAALDAIQGREF